MSTAAIIVIGDEILGGKVVDANSPWLALQLRALGVDLMRISVVPDVLDGIADEVARCSEAFDHVFTSGGVGPTHDDRTMRGIAQAFGVPLQRHPELVGVLRQKMAEPNESTLLMADVPAGAHLLWDGDLYFPVVVMRNVHIFPGVPSLLQRKFSAIAHRFGGVVVHSLEFITQERETEIAERLSAAQERWPAVAIGSYPQFDSRPWTVTITMDSRDTDALRACEAELRSLIQAEAPRR